MQKIILITVGTPRSSWIKDAVEEYVCRLLGGIDFIILPIKPSKSPDPNKQREEESNRIIEALKKQSGQIWVLDESGIEFTSEKFSNSLQELRDQGEVLIFVLGGAYGLNNDVRSCADRVIALSKMTFPHELCQLVFMEQLYRAVQIQKGTGYHH